jgi:hypothetical protein
MMATTTNTVSKPRKSHLFTLSSLRNILPAAAHAMSGEHGSKIGELVCYCPRVSGWYRVTRVIPSGRIRYRVQAISA